MERNSALIRERNEAIFRDWTHLHDTQKYQSEYVLEQLQQKYYLTSNTIYKIVKKVANGGF